MALMIGDPHLSIAGSPTVGQSNLTVSYVVYFDALDINTDQTYHAHATVIGVDEGPGEDGHDEKIYEWGMGDFHASMVAFPGLPLFRTLTFSVPNSTLNEDAAAADGKPRRDEVRVLVTLTPQVGKVVGPARSNTFKLDL